MESSWGFDRNANNEIITLEVDKRVGDVMCISQLLELKVIHRSVKGGTNSE